MAHLDTDHLKTIEQRLLWLSHWMIHNANHIRSKADGIKVGGHQASSASMVSIMTPLYFSALRPEDRALARDDRPCDGDDPPGVAFTYAPG